MYFFQGTLGIGILAQMRLQTGAMMTWMSPAADACQIISPAQTDEANLIITPDICTLSNIFILGTSQKKGYIYEGLCSCFVCALFNMYSTVV